MTTCAAAAPELTEAYRRYRPRLLRLALGLVDDPATAEDVVQDVFAGLHRRGDGLRDPDALPGYLRTATLNRARSVLRRRRTERAYVPPHVPDAGSAESMALTAGERRGVAAALHALPPRQRQVLFLRYYGDLSEAQIAETTGISRGSVKSAASRGLRSVSTMLA
ncbi:RNA polymerase sigma-70 factor (sigma-E family) [Pseudonocardia sediminis]|uniref:RNA polymerase sigma-70 factor (Sigma-E family) n=1 Tax=Pseudonocardia sediminis TaxID=1397368 RepID=A0A4Q7V3F9_PSEST|nr:SigE family RNA polymerase sigma factor [Pseudonocardia sediminis]RZT87213.1 RNA polymerase sigma-70 factor (sigma-E family) [Pseudonocardia sediminis]